MDTHVAVLTEAGNSADQVRIIVSAPLLGLVLHRIHVVLCGEHIGWKGTDSQGRNSGKSILVCCKRRQVQDAGRTRDGRTSARKRQYKWAVGWSSQIAVEPTDVSQKNMQMEYPDAG